MYSCYRYTTKTHFFSTNYLTYVVCAQIYLMNNFMCLYIKILIVR